MVHYGIRDAHNDEGHTHQPARCAAQNQSFGFVILAAQQQSVITHLKGLKLDGTNPTYLYGYGGFDIPITPSFRVSNLVWMEMGGVLAVANIRGGGEYGKAWHEAGMKLNKQNCFANFGQPVVESGTQSDDVHDAYCPYSCVSAVLLLQAIE